MLILTNNLSEGMGQETKWVKQIKKDPSYLDDYWIFIGASAGGLEAIKEFLNHFEDFEDSFIVIAQHLDPKHPTILKDLLGRITDTPIYLVTEDFIAEKGSIHIISPGHNAKINNGKIELSPAAEVGPKPSIDLLLRLFP